jgi:hypothetical protein
MQYKLNIFNYLAPSMDFAFNSKSNQIFTLQINPEQEKNFNKYEKRFFRSKYCLEIILDVIFYCIQQHLLKLGESNTYGTKFWKTIF